MIDAPCVRDIPQEDQFALLYHKMNLLRPRIMVCIQPLAKGDMFCRMRILNVLRQIQKQGTAILMIAARSPIRLISRTDCSSWSRGRWRQCMRRVSLREL